MAGPNGDACIRVGAALNTIDASDIRVAIQNAVKWGPAFAGTGGKGSLSQRNIIPIPSIEPVRVAAWSRPPPVLQAPCMPSSAMNVTQHLHMLTLLCYYILNFISVI